MIGTFEETAFTSFTLFQRIAYYFNPDVFEIEHHLSCDYDFVHLNDGTTERGISIGTYCADSKPANIDGSTASNKLTVTFYSDEDGAARGFEMVYWLIVDGR
jgi:hypothetical protein